MRASFVVALTQTVMPRVSHPRLRLPALRMHFSTMHVVSALSRELNPGLTVRRILPQAKCRSVGSFVFFDHFGPTASSESNMNVGPHPHIGLCTLTYLYEGSILHRDSTGAERAVLPSQVNWMCAGRGVTHSERSIVASSAATHGGGVDAATGMHGLQFWVALPKEYEDVDPSFHYSESVVDIPTADASVQVSLVVGSVLGGKQSRIPILPGTGDLFLLDVKFGTSDASWSCPIDDGIEVGIYVSSGKIYCQGQNASVGDMVVLKDSTELELFALETDTRVAIIGGTPLPEPRHLLWNFCSHDKAKLAQAAESWKILDRNMFPPVVNESNDDSIPMPGR
jgi:redox-sensitive bicupin YhaK (pirin superfamily)